jgi:enoyl-CoA hydratase/carnithine racemase
VSGIEIERRGAGLWAHLDRSEALNALDEALLEGLADAAQVAEEDHEVRALVITGRGRAFSAGADLKLVERLASQGRLSDYTGRLSDVFNRVESLPLPVIAAVNGLALAGGLELVLCCDLVIAEESAQLGDAHANYGLLPGGGASARLPRKIGPTAAKYWLFTGLVRPASELAGTGLLNAVVADGTLIEHVDELVALLATRSPLGLATMKRLVDEGLDQSKADALQAESAARDAHAHSVDMREGMAAFREKRAPRFIGR